MWTTVITGVFALAGVFVGTALEPVKNLITARAKTRQVRGEQCARLIGAATVIQQRLVSLNADFRAERAREQTATDDQRSGWIQEVNDGKAALRQSSDLLFLYGPDVLARKAREVRDAELAAHKLLESPGTDPDPMTVPADLDAALQALEKTTLDFAVLARRYTR
ncbi:hypothetical protein [Amycolatopsis sp. VC5-11]|uniref:hypothetical protein n=1 Tax=Amycolatopsis sp. VC5-11 TaxID=3120156 RepID=UPI003008977F